MGWALKNAQLRDWIYERRAIRAGLAAT